MQVVRIAQEDAAVYLASGGIASPLLASIFTALQKQQDLSNEQIAEMLLQPAEMK